MRGGKKGNLSLLSVESVGRMDPGTITVNSIKSSFLPTHFPFLFLHSSSFRSLNWFLLNFIPSHTFFIPSSTEPCLSCAKDTSQPSSFRPKKRSVLRTSWLSFPPLISFGLVLIGQCHPRPQSTPVDLTHTPFLTVRRYLNKTSIRPRLDFQPPGLL